MSSTRSGSAARNPEVDVATPFDECALRNVPAVLAENQPP